MDQNQLFVPVMQGAQLADLLRRIVREEVRDGVRAELSTYQPKARKALTLPDLATITQISRALDVTRMTVTQWAKASKGRPALLTAVEGSGTRRLFRREDVLALIESSNRLQALQLNPEDGTVAPALSIG